MYSVQETGKSVDTNPDEIEQFIGIIVQMGILKYPQYRMYWSPKTRSPIIANVMGLTRFENLKRFFHVNDNSEMPDRGSVDFDQLYKVRHSLDSVLSCCQKVPQEENQSIDEQIIPTKGRSSLRQYLPNKPHKWGIKVWARCGVSGIIYDFDVYVGKQDDQNVSREFGKVGAVVIKLTRNLPKDVGHKVFMDNLFTTINLVKYLKSEGIWTLGTMRLNRMGGAQKLLKSKKELVKEGRGSFDYRVDANSNIMVMAWLDNGSVQLISSFIGPTIGKQAKRWSGKEKKIVVTCPDIVHQYNAHMGGVDLADMLLALYRIKVGTKKWYYHIIYYCLGVAIINGWLLYKRHAMQNKIEKKNIMKLLEFQRRVAGSLLQENKLEPGRRRSDTIVLSKKRKTIGPPMPPTEIRFDYVDHLPIFEDKQQRCKNCTNGYSRIKCHKCNVHLCIVTARNCFFDYHKNN